MQVTIEEHPSQANGVTLDQVTVSRRSMPLADAAAAPDGVYAQGLGSGSAAPAPTAAPLDLHMLNALVSAMRSAQRAQSIVPSPIHDTSPISSLGGLRSAWNGRADLAAGRPPAAGPPESAQQVAAVNATGAGLQATGQVLQERSPAIMQACTSSLRSHHTLLRAPTGIGCPSAQASGVETPSNQCRHASSSREDSQLTHRCE